MGSLAKIGQTSKVINHSITPSIEKMVDGAQEFILGRGQNQDKTLKQFYKTQSISHGQDEGLPNELSLHPHNMRSDQSE